ncbi:MAG: type IV secretion system protein B4, partial [Deltaproteobacteria bacterium]
MRHEPKLDALSLMPLWAKKEKSLATLLPYVSLVNDVTVRTRGNEFFQCIRLEGINSYTTDDAYLDKVRALFAGIVAQSGTEFSFYIHKVSKSIDPALRPIRTDDFAGHLDQRWSAHLAAAQLRDRSLTLTVIKRPPFGRRIPFTAAKSAALLQQQTAKQVQKLSEVVNFLTSTFAQMSPRLLSAKSGELLGFLGGINTGQEWPLLPSSTIGFVADDVANTRVTFQGPNFELSEGSVGKRVGTSFAIKSYPARTFCTMFDELNLPVDMVVTQSFTPLNSNIMSGRIKRRQRHMRASDDGALSLLSELGEALDDLESKRLSFGDHHMSVTVFAETAGELETAAAEIRNIAASTGVNLVNEGFAARSHYFAQHPGNAAKRSRKAAITNRNFADFGAFHRTGLGKDGRNVPWGTPITMFPTLERSGYWFNYHEKGSPDKEPSSGHTLFLGRSGSGKSVLS